MKLLILSASIGSGHTKAANAIAEAFNGQSITIDFMDKNISTVNWLLKKLYLLMLSLIPDLYDRIYKIAGFKRFGSITRLIWSTLMYLPFTKLLYKIQPDIIICTHPFPEAAASLWKFLHAKHAKKFLLAAVLTDYSLHEIWIYNEVDLYFVATEEMKAELESQGNYAVFASGIPIGQEFNIDVDSKAATFNFQLLMMGGGLGLGSIEDTINELDEVDLKLNIVVVTGKNKRLQSRLQSIKSKHNIKILGYVDNVKELMINSDLLITKPGALTLTESFAIGLPLLLHAPIPGPEAENARYALTHKAACSVDKGAATAVREIFSNPTLLKDMRRNSKALARPDAANKIIETCLKYFEQ